ncbi:hypothetical protein O181_099367 [Austropuccinia psidii MF-1]|uniref:Uncharacterized protein n=1 Tax=Austropuccinia psidii MF-1 TaxID=1389203 RepID=A0A9Q3JD45_9BASI|nr:hypothetical protein [Austropuccinia psidii MF-1]
MLGGHSASVRMVSGVRGMLEGLYTSLRVVSCVGGMLGGLSTSVRIVSGVGGMSGGLSTSIRIVSHVGGMLGGHYTSVRMVSGVGGISRGHHGESSHYPSYRRTANPDRAHSDSSRLTRRRPNQLSSDFTPFRNQQISGQEPPFFTFPGSFQEKTRIKGQKQDLFSPKAEKVRPNDPETVGLGERSRQEPEIVVNNSRISSPFN